MGFSQRHRRRAGESPPGRTIHPLPRRQLGDRVVSLIVDRHRIWWMLGRGGAVELRGLAANRIPNTHRDKRTIRMASTTGLFGQDHDRRSRSFRQLNLLVAESGS